MSFERSTRDPRSGRSFSNYKARMYSPTLGRFMQTDPIGYSDGMNLYAYVKNDPANFVDPTGLNCVWSYGPILNAAGETVGERLLGKTCGGGGPALWPRTWNDGPGGFINPGQGHVGGAVGGEPQSKVCPVQNAATMRKIANDALNDRNEGA